MMDVGAGGGDFVSALLGAVVGWALGIFGPPLTAIIERRRRRSEVLQVMAGELHEVRFLVTMVWLSLLGRARKVDQRALNVIKPVLLSFRGDTEDDAFIGAMRNLLGQGDVAFIQAQNRPTPGSAPMPVYYEAPFFASHIADLSLYPVWLQQRLLRAGIELRAFNYQVDLVRANFERTFDSSLTGHGAQAVMSNVEEGYRMLTTRAEYLVRAIDAVLGPTGEPMVE